jgi:AcrR family transcriptional regulator
MAAPLADTRFERRRRRTRESILEVATALFQERGIAAVRVEEICERADIAQRTFFNHFRTREHLYEAIARGRAARFAELLDAQGGDARPLATRLPELFAAIAANMDAIPVYRELVGEMLHLRIDGASETVRTRILGAAALRFVADGVARGEITRRHAPETLADILLGTLIAALTNWSASPDYALEDGLAASAAALLDLFTPTDPADSIDGDEDPT